MKEKCLIRVFPSRTAATPDDELAFVGDPPLQTPAWEEVAAVHVSAAFTWQIEEAGRLFYAWRLRYGSKVKLGGPAFDDPGDEFIAGRYLKPGYVITSRGCPNRCDFCSVPRREGELRELPVTEGWNVLDNNLLACSRAHLLKVFDMLRRQEEPPLFTGGFEARRVDAWLVEQLRSLRVRRLYLAYDNPACGITVARAASLLVPHFRAHAVGCYVLVGQAGDTVADAAERLEWVRSLGLVPRAMYYQPAAATRRSVPELWRDLVRRYSQPRLMFQKDPVEVDEPGLF